MDDWFYCCHNDYLRCSLLLISCLISFVIPSNWDTAFERSPSQYLPSCKLFAASAARDAMSWSLITIVDLSVAIVVLYGLGVYIEYTAGWGGSQGLWGEVES